MALVCVFGTAFSTGAKADFEFEEVTTPHIIVIDANDMNAASPIFERAADEKIYPASTTKMLTCLIALEQAGLDKEVTVGSEIQGFFETKKGYTEQSSLMKLVEGETVTMRDLLYGLMLVSGNDAADAIAVAVGGSIENFVSMMNSRAQELGMTGSHFVNPNGVHNDDHYSTARDMAKLAAYAMTNPDFQQIVATPSYTVPANSVRTEDINLINSNFLITSASNEKYSSYPYEYAIGIKTGMTPKSGYCLVAGAEKDGARCIACLYGDPSDGFSMDRFSNAKKIFEKVFDSTYVTVDGGSLNLQNTFSMKLDRARSEDVDENGEVQFSVDTTGFSIRVLPGQAEALLNGSTPVVADVQWVDGLCAPIHQGQQVGIVNYKLDGNSIYSVPILSPRDVLEVAVISPGNGEDDASQTEAPPDTLLAEPAENVSETKSSSPNLLVIILVALIAVLAIALVIVLVAAAQENKRAKKRRQQKKRSSGRQNGGYARSGRGNGGYSDSRRYPDDRYRR